MNKIFTLFITIFLLLVLNASGQEKKLHKYTGVVTIQLLPAKVLQINKIDYDPEPGTSYISDSNLVVEVETNPEVMANWSVVEVEYYKYDKPKVIEYDFFSEKKKLTVNYYAKKVKILGNLSDFVD